MIIGRRAAKNVQIVLIGWKTWPPGDETSFFLCKYRDNFKNLLVKINLVDWKKFNTCGHWVTIYQRLFTFLSVEKHDCQRWSSYVEICYKSSCQNTTWSNCFRNSIKVSNSLDPNSLGPNCLQMLSVEKTLARVKRSCQKFLGYLKKNQHIWS